MQRQTKLEELSAYKIAFNLSNYVWDTVSAWDYFTKDTIGNQLVRAVDSISANIAEAYGRYYKKDKIKFYFYAKGSLYECFDFVEKAKIRNIISKDKYEFIRKNLELLPKELNMLIKYTQENLKL